MTRKWAQAGTTLRARRSIKGNTQLSFMANVLTMYLALCPTIPALPTIMLNQQTNNSKLKPGSQMCKLLATLRNDLPSVKRCSPSLLTVLAREPTSHKTSGVRIKSPSQAKLTNNVSNALPPTLHLDP
jgi:hypothetical protein